MKRYKPSEKMPEVHGLKVIIFTTTGWAAGLWDNENNLFATYAENGDEISFRPTEITAWCDPMEEE